MIGLEKIRQELSSYDTVPHTLFTGARGTGKTMLSKWIARQRRKELIFLTGNTLTLKKLNNVFLNLKEDDIILIDEIHRTPARVEEDLYQPLNANIFPITTPDGNNYIYRLPRFTLLATTTQTAKISKPLLSRFKLIFHIPEYTTTELAEIIQQQGFSFKDAIKIAKNVITPREAVNLAYRIRNLHLEVSKALEFVGYRNGLNEFERKYLEVLQKVKPQRLSLTSLAFALQLDKEEIYSIEDKLIRRGLIDINSRGRGLKMA